MALTTPATAQSPGSVDTPPARHQVKGCGSLQFIAQALQVTHRLQSWRTEATAMPMAFHRLPVAANTGAATMTPCVNSVVRRSDVMHDVHTCRVDEA